MTGITPSEQEQIPTQLWPEDKFPFGDPFSYAKAIIKENVTYPIVPICPIINEDNLETLDISNIPVGTFFIIHSPRWDWRQEALCLRVPDDAKSATDVRLIKGFIIVGMRTNITSSWGGNAM